MNNILYKEIENRILDMYDKMKQIEKLQKECESLQLHAELIRRDIVETNIDIEAEMHFGIDYSSINVQTSSNGDSHMDKEMIAAITRLEREWKDVRTKLLKRRQKIRELERSILGLKLNIDLLNKENRDFIELVYKNKLSIPDVASRMNMSHMTAYRKRKELLNDINKWTSFV